MFDFSAHAAKVCFETEDGSERIVLKLSPQEAVLYLMIARKSVEGDGLDWREHLSKTEKQALLHEYNLLYRHVGKGNSVSEYKDRTNPSYQDAHQGLDGDS